MGGTDWARDALWGRLGCVREGDNSAARREGTTPDEMHQQ